MPSPAQPEEKESFKNLIRNAWWAYRMVYRLAGKEMIVLVILTIISTAFPTINAYIGGVFIDQLLKIVSTKAIPNNFFSFQTPLIKTLLLISLAIITRSIIGNLRSYLRNRYEIIHRRRFEVELYQRIADIDVCQFENPKVNDLTRKGTENIYKVGQFFNSSVALVGQLSSLAISAIICFKFSPLLSLFIILLCIPNNIIFNTFNRLAWNFYNTSQETNRKKWWLFGSLNNSINVHEHKITQAHQRIGQLAEEINQSLTKQEIGPYTYRWKRMNLLAILDIIAYIATPLYLAVETIIGRITIGGFTFYRSMFDSFYGNANDILAEFSGLRDTANYLSHVYKLWHLEPEIKNGILKIKQQTPPEIEFKNVSFTYPQAKNIAINHINLLIKPGEEIALVGENGAGKTTLIKLLLRYYDPTEGDILINGINLKNIDLDTYYHLIGSLFQQYNTYGSLDIENNIYLGNSTKPIDLPKIKLAAQKAEAESFIVDLKDKYSQILSPTFTGGTNLSTGQWQKLALARMFYRDFQVLILDEPTASIDAEAEYKIFQRIYQTSKDKTLIIISHRFSTVRNAQHIYVLDQGKIVEQGSHDELVKLDGKYAKAFKLQASGYKT